jgi:hypothetical protein
MFGLCPGPPGLFAAFGKRLFFLEGTTVSEYTWENCVIVSRETTVRLATTPQWKPGQTNTRLITDGETLILTQGQQIVTFSLLTGAQLHAETSTSKGTLTFALDFEGGYFIESPQYDPILLYPLRDAYRFHRTWFVHPSDLPLVEWGKEAVSWCIQALAVSDPAPLRLTVNSLKVLLDLGLKFPPQLAPFADLLAYLLAIAYRQFRDFPRLTQKRFLAVIRLPGLTSLGRSAFVSALVWHGDPKLFMSYEFCEKWVATLTASESIAIFSAGFYDATTLLYVFLYSEAGLRILDEVANMTSNSLGFFGALETGVLRAIHANLMTTSAIFPLLAVIPRIAAPWAIEMLLPPLMPFLSRVISPTIVPQIAFEAQIGRAHD